MEAQSISSAQTPSEARMIAQGALKALGGAKDAREAVFMGAEYLGHIEENGSEIERNLAGIARLNKSDEAELGWRAESIAGNQRVALSVIAHGVCGPLGPSLAAIGLDMAKREGEVAPYFSAAIKEYGTDGEKAAMRVTNGVSRSSETLKEVLQLIAEGSVEKHSIKDLVNMVLSDKDFKAKPMYYNDKRESITGLIKEFAVSGTPQEKKFAEAFESIEWSSLNGDSALTTTLANLMAGIQGPVGHAIAKNGHEVLMGNFKGLAPVPMYLDTSPGMNELAPDAIKICRSIMKFSDDPKERIVAGAIVEALKDLEIDMRAEKARNGKERPSSEVAVAGLAALATGLKGPVEETLAGFASMEADTAQVNRSFIESIAIHGDDAESRMVTAQALKETSGLKGAFRSRKSSSTILKTAAGKVKENVIRRKVSVDLENMKKKARDDEERMTQEIRDETAALDKAKSGEYGSRKIVNEDSWLSIDGVKLEKSDGQGK